MAPPHLSKGRLKRVLDDWCPPYSGYHLYYQGRGQPTQAFTLLVDTLVIAAGATKVHLDVQFTRYRVDNSVIGSFRSLWIVTKDDGRWGVAARSSFAD